MIMTSEQIIADLKLLTNTQAIEGMASFGIRHTMSGRAKYTFSCEKVDNFCEGVPHAVWFHSSPRGCTHACRVGP